MPQLKNCRKLQSSKNVDFKGLSELCKKSSYTNKPHYTTILVDFWSIVGIVGTFWRVMKKNFFKKKYRPPKVPTICQKLLKNVGIQC